MPDLVLLVSAHCFNEGQGLRTLVCNPRLHGPAAGVTKGERWDQRNLLMPVRREEQLIPRAIAGPPQAAVSHSPKEGAGVPARIRVTVKTKGILLATPNSRVDTYRELGGHQKTDWKQKGLQLHNEQGGHSSLMSHKSSWSERFSTIKQG